MGKEKEAKRRKGRRGSDQVGGEERGEKGKKVEEGVGGAGIGA